MAHCTDAFSRGWTQMIRILFQPFRLVFWLKMALLALLMGGATSFRGNFPSGGGTTRTTTPGSLPTGPFQDMANAFMENAAFYVLILFGVMLLVLIFSFLASIAKFLFYEGTLSGVSYFIDGFKNNVSGIVSYFLWNILVGLLFVIVISVSAFMIILLVFGGFSAIDMSPNESLPIILLITLGLGLGLILIIVGIIYTEMLEAMVVPLMVVHKYGIFHSWGITIRLVLENLFEFLGFVLIRIGITLIVWFAMFIFFIFIGIFGFLFLSAIVGPGRSTEFGMLTLFFLTLTMLPGMYLVNIVILPISVLMHAYALSFTGSLLQDPAFDAGQDPPEGSAPVTTPSAPVPTPPPSSSGSVMFRDIPDHRHSPPAGPEV